MHDQSNTQRELQPVCFECGGSRLVEHERNQEFSYGPSDDAVTLTARVPVVSCLDCGYEYFDERGEAARHAAICHHLGVQSPEEIRVLRLRIGASRGDFCELTGFGMASLQRWESGNSIPNVSNGALMFLLEFPENVQRLKRRKRSDPVSEVESDLEESRAARVELWRSHRARRFPRLVQRPRVLAQAASWPLRPR